MRPIWTAEEMGLDYEVENDAFSSESFYGKNLDINILGTVPYMVDGDVNMTESVGAQYFVDKYGPTNLKVNA